MLVSPPGSTTKHFQIAAGFHILVDSLASGICARNFQTHFSYGIHLITISQKILNIFIIEISLKFTNLRLKSNPPGANELTHWGRVTHICVGKLIIIGSDNGLSPDRHQAIIWTNTGLLSIGPLRTYFSEILIGIQTFSFKKMRLKVSSAKWRPSCLGLNVLMSKPMQHIYPQPVQALQGTQHSRPTRSTSWLLMPWLLVNPRHQQPRQWQDMQWIIPWFYI